MRYQYSAQLCNDVSSQVQAAFKNAGIVNVAAVAEQVRVANLAENVALEDIEPLVLRAAQLLGAPIEFDGLTNGLALPDSLEEEHGEGAITPPGSLPAAPMQ